MDKLDVVVALVALAGCCLMAWLSHRIWLWWQDRTPAASADSPRFGSDDQAPAHTIQFNAAIIAACGTRLSPEQKLDMLTQPGITIALALTRARKILEGEMPADSLTIRSAKIVKLPVDPT